jgi:Acetyltransferase (GNAT) domain
MIVWQGRLCRFGDIYFGEESVAPEEVDVIRHFHRLHPVPGVPCSTMQTILIELAPDPEVLLADVSKNTRYEIRRAAEKDGVEYEAVETTAQAVDEFARYYAHFAALKGLPPLTTEYLHALASTRALDLSVARHQGEVLVWHAYYRGRERVRLLHSVSLYRTSEDSARRNLIGRANRYHHWQDMCRFRADAIALYDFGGWYEGAKDHEKVRINAFKEEFGGNIMPTFSCQQAVTVKGQFVLALHGAADSVRSGLRVADAARRRMKSTRAKPPSPPNGSPGEESHVPATGGAR